jgi:hypothetical protein
MYIEIVSIMYLKSVRDGLGRNFELDGVKGVMCKEEVQLQPTHS